ncbi:MAG: DUF559 domain-containing protein [bacterium]|nr:DUF559 domain-containing protein [bacterium]
MHHIHNSKEMRLHRQELRRNLTPQELKLWPHLRRKKLGVLFYRQHSIGPYIVDFYCPAKRLIIELDAYLQHLNQTILRFWNSEIDDNILRVVEIINSIL